MNLAEQKKKKDGNQIVRSLHGEVTPSVPFWLMRQAGRHLPEYIDVRKKAGSFLDLCFTPDYAAEVTLQPVRRYDTDAAILFSDILVVPYALGQTLDFVEGEGPRLGALPAMEDFENLCFNDFDKQLAPVYETIVKVRGLLDPSKALIGFAGAPWTIACYMIQGQGDGEFTAARTLAMTQPDIFTRLVDRITEATSLYLLNQIKSGVDAVQIFDSWAGLLSETSFQRWVIEPTRKITARIREQYPDIPVIGFPRGAGGLYPQYAMKTGISCLGLDTQVPLGWALRECGKDICLQGNLDPVCLLAGGAALEKEMLRILELVKSRPFIFNLGHGVLRDTPPAHVERLAAIVKNFKR